MQPFGAFVARPFSAPNTVYVPIIGAAPKELYSYPYALDSGKQIPYYLSLEISMPERRWTAMRVPRRINPPLRKVYHLILRLRRPHSSRKFTCTIAAVTQGLPLR